MLFASDILFPDEKWNKFKNTEIFVGTLTKQLENDFTTSSILQRFNPYKLKNGTETTDVYTGTGDVPILNKYLDSKVEIKGKLVQFELEGSYIK